MNDTDRELLAGFHHTISEQLNSRLSESPKFFGLLVIVATGYGYVLANDKLACNAELFVSVSLLSYLAVLWACWYLAALSYGFRFLQNIQHCVERTLGWNPRYVPRDDGKKSTLWTLPSIYHPHASGLCVVLAIICGVFVHHSSEQWRWPLCYVSLLSALAFMAGIIFMYFIYKYYFDKFIRKRNPCDSPSAGVQATQNSDAD